MDQEAVKVLEEFGVTGVYVHRDIIDVSSCSERRDEDWQFTDTYGHHHWYNKRTKRYPTLVQVVDCPETEDYPEDWHYECCICGEEIHPGTKPPSCFRERIPGLLHITITFDKWGTIPITEDENSEICRCISNKYDYGYSRLRKVLTNILIKWGFDVKST